MFDQYGTVSEELIDIPIPGEPRHTLVVRLRKRKDGADTYQARRIIPKEYRQNIRNPYTTRSLGTPDLDTAKMLAVKWEREVKSKIDRGDALHPLPFSKVAIRYISDASDRAKLLDSDGRPLVAASNVARDEGVVRRYLIPFFGETDVREITQSLCDRYLAWRSDYYVTGPGRDEQQIDYWRDGKRLSRPVVKNLKPAPSTINKDSVAFNKIMKFAQRHNDLPNLPDAKIMAPSIKGHKARRRPRFDDDELALMLETATSNVAEISGRNHHCRMMLWAFIELILGTGIRVSEAHWLQVKHLEFKPVSDAQQAAWDAAPETWDDDSIVAHKHSYLQNPDGKLMQFRIRVAMDNPGLKDIDHARLVIPAYYYSEVLVYHLDYLAGHVHKLSGQVIDDPLKLPPEQFLFVNYDGSRTKSFRSGFQTLLENSKSDQFPDGLLRKDGKNRPPTSLRHTYASKQIEAGATANGLGFLADNMGTSTEMLRKHYAQVFHELRAEDLQRY